VPCSEADTVPLEFFVVWIQFQIEKNSGPGRVGKLRTAHAEIDTPVFMPVGTVASVKGVSQDVLDCLGVQILLANTYHLYLRPGVDVVRRMGGLHRFMGWGRAILTDSGGFQVFSLNDLRKVTEEGVTFRSHLDGSTHFLSPERAMEVQIGLGADIIMAFDECTEYPAAPERARESMEMTLRWAARSKKYFDDHKEQVPWRDGRQPSGVSFQKHRVASDQWLVAGNHTVDEKTNHQSLTTNHTATASQALFGIVQGGMERELRRESALRTIEIGFSGYAIGGLSVGEPRELTREIVEWTLEHLPSDKPRYLMGVGTPEEIALYARIGVDMMDCVLPTRAARHGLLFTSQGRITIKNARYATDEGPLDPNCGCKVCARYSRAYLRHLYASNELLAQVLNTIHNLAFYLETMRGARCAIERGGFAEFMSKFPPHPATPNATARG
jgi:queuine tRNA-ribosyltransferase